LPDSKTENTLTESTIKEGKIEWKKDQNKDGKWGCLIDRDQNYAFFQAGLTEDEQKYRDYFETEVENNLNDEIIEEKIDHLEIQMREDYKLQNYDFIDTQTRAPEDD
jgi:hypothetical protein